MVGVPERDELLIQLALAEQVITRAIEEAGIDPEVAAAACAALAGDYTAAAAAARGLLLGALLRAAVGTLRRRGTEAYRVLQSGPEPGRA
jgi:hypothetical protein